MRRGSKRKAQLRHAKVRALERYGITVGNRTLAEMVQDIQQGRAEFLERQSLRVTLWRVRGYKVVYDRTRKTIVSFLPDAERPSVWDQIKVAP